MIKCIIWGLVTGTETPLDGLILKLAKFENDKDWHLIGNKKRDDESVMKFYHDTDYIYRDMPINEFKEIWDSGDYEPSSGTTAIINPLNVEIISVIINKGCDPSLLGE